jgi:arginine N-succinyltransferase
MRVVRRVCARDAKAILQLATAAGVGLTTLPADKRGIEQLIARSLENSGYFLFVLEDVVVKKIVGCAAIIANVGERTPFYSYKIHTVTRICPSLKLRKTYKTLMLVNDFQDASEIASLYLDPRYRKDGNGLLLSRSRFLFMSAFKGYFSSQVIADMRGYLNHRGHSPFWEAVGKHFFTLEFAEADRLTTLTDKQFIADLMPRHPIYVPILPKSAQQVIGKTHPETRSALKILQREGFVNHNYIDIFDAGPTLDVEREQIKTIQQSRKKKITALSKTVRGEQAFLVSNKHHDFRVVKTENIVLQHNQLTLGSEVAKLLQINVGDEVLICPW